VKFGLLVTYNTITQDDPQLGILCCDGAHVVRLVPLLAGHPFR
jgi:hypothetical protein